MSNNCSFPKCENKKCKLDPEKKELSDYCINHKCIKPKCNNYREYPYLYCMDHRCSTACCMGPKEDGSDYCGPHGYTHNSASSFNAGGFIC